MGTVFRKVALKTLHPDLASQKLIAQRFNREAETVTKLAHPNTITFHDFGKTPEGTLYIVMEYIEGQSLAELLKQGPLAPARIEKILAQICGSLHEAHELGIIHRDLKPENIILTQRASGTDFVKVLDFGIAKRTDFDAESLRLTKAGVVLGTPPYMSPDQFSGIPLDRRSDIYSLGVMTYEMLTGRLPFSAQTPWEWATRHLSEQPHPFEPELENTTPTACLWTVQRALSKEPEDRQSTVLEFLEGFRGNLQLPTQAPRTRQTPAPTPLPKTQAVPTMPGGVKKSPLLAITIIFLIFLAIAGIATGATLTYLLLTRGG
jgi:serine/threonine protein kinase